MKKLILFFMVFAVLAAGCSTPGTPTPTEPAPVASVSEAPSDEPVQTEEAAQEKVNIAVLIPVLGNSYNEAIVNGIKDTAEKMNAEYTVYSSEYSIEKQVQQIQDVIAAGKFNGLIINPNDSVVVHPEIEEAQSAGIAVGAVDSVIGPDLTTLEPAEGVNVVVAVTLTQQGIEFANKVVEVCADKDPCKVIYLMGFQQLSGDQERLRGFHSIIDQYPAIQIVAEQEGEYLQDKGFNVTQNILQSHPDVDVIFTVGDQMSLGAAQAVADAGLTEQVIILGNGASIEGVKAVKDGRLYATFALLPYTEGQLVAEWVIRAARGESVHLGVDMSKQSPPLPPTGAWIDQTNVDSFEPQW